MYSYKLKANSSGYGHVTFELREDYERVIFEKVLKFDDKNGSYHEIIVEPFKHFSNRDDKINNVLIKDFTYKEFTMYIIFHCFIQIYNLYRQ